MRAAQIANSKRLQRVDALLADGREYSTMEIIELCDVCAVNSIVSELRLNGRNIDCRQHKRLFYYRRVDL